MNTRLRPIQVVTKPAVSYFFVRAIVSLCSLQYYFFLADIKFIHKLITELKAVWQENKKVWRYLFIRLFLKIPPSFRGNSRTFRCSKLEKDKKRIEQLFIYFCFFTHWDASFLLSVGFGEKLSGITEEV